MSDGPRHPEVQWAHSLTHVTIKVIIHGAKDIELKTTEDELTFAAKSHDRSMDYAFSLKLFASIVPEDTKHDVFAKHIMITLKKQAIADWTNLFAGSGKNHRIKADWDAWVDFEEEEAAQAQAEAARLEAKKKEDADALMATAQRNSLEELLKKDGDKNTKAQAEPPTQMRAMKRLYLLSYNALLWLGWTGVLFLLLTSAPANAWANCSRLVMLLEAIGLLEIFNAVLKIVPGNPLPSFILHGGRDFALWFIFSGYAAEPLFEPLLGAWLIFLVWGVGEVIRYPTYLMPLLGLEVPKSLMWLRYSANLLLLPAGFIGEMRMIWAASNVVAAPWSSVYKAYLLLFIPAAPWLVWTMWKQRQSKLYRKPKSA